METPYHNKPEHCPICGAPAPISFVQNYAGTEKWSLYECSSCKVQFWIPLVVPQGAIYEEEVAYQGKGSILTKKNARTIVEGYWNAKQFLKGPLARNVKEKKLLDVGCGTGEFMFVAQEIGYATEGMDFNKHAVAFAKERLGLEGAVVADVYQFLRAKKGVYDVITALEVIEHIPNPGKFLEYAYDALKPEGHLVISTPNRNRYWKKISLKVESWDFPYQHLLRWDTVSLENFVKRFGFSAMIMREELPTDWFIAKLKCVAGWFIRGQQPNGQRTVSEQMRDAMGFSRYQWTKKLILGLCTIPSWVMFTLLRFKGVHLYAVFQKKP